MGTPGLAEAAVAVGIGGRREREKLTFFPLSLMEPASAAAPWGNQPVRPDALYIRHKVTAGGDTVVRALLSHTVPENCCDVSTKPPTSQRDCGGKINKAKADAL